MRTCAVRSTSTRRAKSPPPCRRARSRRSTSRVHRPVVALGLLGRDEAHHAVPEHRLLPRQLIEVLCASARCGTLLLLPLPSGLLRGNAPSLLGSLFAGAQEFRDGPSFDEPDDTWAEGSGELSSLISTRSELARGDLRALYLGWRSKSGSCIRVQRHARLDFSVFAGRARVARPSRLAPLEIVDFPCR